MYCTYMLSFSYFSIYIEDTWLIIISFDFTYIFYWFIDSPPKTILVTMCTGAADNTRVWFQIFTTFIYLLFCNRTCMYSCIWHIVQVWILFYTYVHCSSLSCFFFAKKDQIREQPGLFFVVAIFQYRFKSASIYMYIFGELDHKH